jgi:hypothetical protein
MPADHIVAGQHYLSTPFRKSRPYRRWRAAAGQEHARGGRVLLLPLHNPVDIAEQVATLDVICEGRFIFGVGLGYRDGNEAFGVQPRSVAHLLRSYKLSNACGVRRSDASRPLSTSPRLVWC